MKIFLLFLLIVIILACVVRWYWFEVVIPVRKEQEPKDDTEDFYL